MAVKSGLGGVSFVKTGQFSRQQNSGPQRTLDGRPTSISKRELAGIESRRAATKQREALEAKQDYFSPGQMNERASEAFEDGEVAIGSIGRNTAGDTRMAKVLGALGINEDLMRAIIASAQIRPSDNR